jgi:hypothetical protein
MRLLILTSCLLSLVSCASPPSPPAKETPAAQSKPGPAPSDESRRFPQKNLVSTQVVPSALLGKAFMPGGTLARYRKGKTEYQMFVARAASSTEAAIKLNDWRTALTNPAFVASFGGYFGLDGGIPVFVFAKGEWIAGVVGLSRREADLASRSLASRL